MKLLLVEDDGRLAQQLRQVLVRAGYTVEQSDDGKGFEGKGSTASFGMKLIESLGQQLRTRAQWVPTKPGTLVRLSVPASQIS